MVIDILYILRVVFAHCSIWFTNLLTATDGTGVVISAFLIYLIVSLLIIPFRGGRIGAFGGFSDRVRKSSNKGNDDQFSEVFVMQYIFYMVCLSLLALIYFRLGELK